MSVEFFLMRPLEWILPRVTGLVGFLFWLNHRFAPPDKVCVAEFVRTQAGPFLRLLWALRYARVLVCSPADIPPANTGEDKTAPGCMWLDNRYWWPWSLFRNPQKETTMYLVFVHGGGFTSHTVSNPVPVHSYNEPDTLRLMSSNQHARAWCECICLPGSADSSPQNIYGLVA